MMDSIAGSISLSYRQSDVFFSIAKCINNCPKAKISFSDLGALVVDLFK